MTFPFDAELKAKQNREKARLRNDATYVGAISVALTLVTQYAYAFIVKILMTFGVLSGNPYYTLDNTRFLLFYSAVWAFSFLLPSLMVSHIYGRKFVPFSPARPVPFFFAVLLIFAAVGLCMLSNIINAFVSAFLREMGANVPAPTVMMVNTPTSFVLNLFTIAVLPALLEEMVWRGYILRSLRAYGDGFAVVVSALLFSLMHGNLRQIPFAFIVGLFLGYLYVQTNNIWIPILVHFINNSISTVMEYLSFFCSPEFISWLTVYVIYGGLILLGLLSVLILLLAYRDKMKLRKNGSGLSVVGRYRALFTTPMFVSAVLLYIVLLILGM